MIDRRSPGRFARILIRLGLVRPWCLPDMHEWVLVRHIIGNEAWIRSTLPGWWCKNCPAATDQPRPGDGP